MLSGAHWLTPTRASGIAAYGGAVACCVIAWAKNRPNLRVSRIAASFTAIEGLLLLDIIFNGRWLLHNWIGALAQSHNAYRMRRLPQSIADLLLFVLLVFGSVAVARFFRRSDGLRFAALGVLLSVLTWCAEVVSLHQVDTILYHQLGEWMVVSLVWIVASIMTSIGILIGSRYVPTQA